MSGAEAGNPKSIVWKLTLCYDGSPYAGWQVQPDLPTVQGELAAAIHRVTGEAVLPQGSGRTDAGVHALAQVASCALAAPIPAANLLRALNYTLPRSIRVTEAQPASGDFHARHSAIAKTYEYRIWRAELCPPWTAPYVYAFDFPLSLEKLHAAAARFLGTHDFRSFQAQKPDRSERSRSEEGERTTVRTIFASSWEQPSSELLVYTVRGSGFLHHMVRNLVGTCLSAGRGMLAPEAIPAILAARTRAAAGPTAPASGLWLHSVTYPDHATEQVSNLPSVLR